MRDLKFLIHLQRQEPHALGFITTEGLEARIVKGRVYIAEENDEPAAFALFDCRGRHATIHQTAAMYDARRRHHALALAAAVREAAGRKGAARVNLACASDLASALAFWRAAGFVEIGTRPGGEHRKRTLHLFQREVINGVQPDLLDMPHPVYDPRKEWDNGARRYSRQRKHTRALADRLDVDGGAGSLDLFSDAIRQWDAGPLRPSVLVPAPEKS